MDYKIIGANIRKYRKQNKLTQTELGKLIGKTESSIRKYERGYVIIPLDVLNKIADVLNVPAYRIIDVSNISMEANSLEIIEKFLESIGYICEYVYDVEKWHYEDVCDDSNKLIGKSQVADEETYSVKLTKNGVCTTYSKEEFEQFKMDIEQSIDYLVWKKKQNDK